MSKSSSGVINLVTDDEEEEPIIRRAQKRPRTQRTPSPRPPQLPSNPPTNSDDDLVVVSQTKRGKATNRADTDLRQFTRPKQVEAEEGVECVGEVRGIQALADYPHFRFQCALEQFKRARSPKKEQFCPMCFCYVCDIPAAQCKTWISHARAIDTIPKWRAEREARLEERRRREQCGTIERGTVVSRISAPVRVRQSIDDSSSFENGSSSDALEGEGESCSGDEVEDVTLKCDFDRTIQRMDQVAIETDCFKMVSLQRELDAENVKRQSRMRRRGKLDLMDLLD